MHTLDMVKKVTIATEIRQKYFAIEVMWSPQPISSWDYMR